MDWIKQNKFLSGYFIILLIAAGALGFLAFSAMGKYQTAYSEYQGKASELKNLESKQPFPEEANVKKMQDLQTAHQAAIDTLHKDLAKSQIALKPLTPEKFQDNLRDAVRRVTARAAERGTELKEGFYMGFDAYQAVPPRAEAAAPLGRMLEAMELAINTLLDSRISKLEDLKRDNLPEEGVASATPEPAAKPSASRDKEKDSGSNLVQRHGFEVQFISTEAPFRSILNGLVTSKQQFFVPVSIAIESQLEKPMKAGDGGQPPGETLTWVVGAETLKVTMRVDIVNFTEPALKAESAAAK